jgi:single-strand DNA-binding protein
MNKAIIVGRLGRDPEVKTTQGGTAVCTLAVATTDREKVGGEWQSVTEWHQVVVWGRQAELCGEHLVKGSSVSVIGRIKRRKYQDKTGAQRESLEIVADDVEFVGPKQASSSAPRGGSGAGKPATTRRDADFSGEIPF